MKLFLILAISFFGSQNFADSPDIATSNEERLLRVDSGDEVYKYFNKRPELSLMEMRAIPSIKDPKVKMKSVDILELFSKFPTNKSLAESLRVWSAEGLEQLYARLSSGPMPFGNSSELQYDGIAFFPKEGMSARIDELMFSIPQVKSILGKFGADQEARRIFVSGIPEKLWHGKVFRNRPGKFTHTLLNRIPHILGLSEFLTMGEEIQKQGGLGFGTFKAGAEWLMMPAKVYCGQSLLDSRKESFVIDYAYSEDVEVQGQRFSGKTNIPVHRKIVGRNGVEIRDEIRMIRPGIYLGRAYLKKQFLLTFVLVNDENRVAGPDACRNPYGSQLAENAL